MKTTRKSGLVILVAGAFALPLASGAAEFTIQDNAAIPAPFTGAASLPTPTVRAPLGEPTFITQETFAKRQDGPVYVRKDGRWVRIDTGNDRRSVRPELGKPTFIVQDDASQRNAGPAYVRENGKWVRTDTGHALQKPTLDAREGQPRKSDG
jgi:hypothetical protein